MPDSLSSKIARPGTQEWAPRFWGRAIRALRWALTCGVLAAALYFPAPAPAGMPDGAAADFAREAWMPALLARDLPARFRALDAMRADPALAREALLIAIGDRGGPAERWRLIRHLAEFGVQEDIPALLALFDGSTGAAERRFITGGVRALYSRSEPSADLSLAVADFIFLQTQPAQPFDAAREGSWQLTPRSFEEFHRAAVPLDLIAALRPLRDRPHAERAALAAAMQKTMSASEWRAWQEALTAALEPLPPRVTMEGQLRVRLVNPADRPLLAQIEFGLWRARFEAEPPPGLLYLNPAEEGRYEVPVRLIAPVSAHPARIDLRLREVNRPAQPVFRKLLVPTQP